MFKWKNRIMAINKAYRTVKETGVKPEKACDYVITQDDEFCVNVESMTKRQFNSYVKEVCDLLEVEK
ncbi:hypothetical protein ACFQZE_07120 [Paenibacillus sp. GCM10027627]|uniref:hypothetical protein n=1 Tax=unclassified Paenibacillus TaxID=185978 RepID=UPI0036326CAE